MKITKNNNILEQCDNLEHKGRMIFILIGCFVGVLSSTVYADTIFSQDEITQDWIDKVLLPIYARDVHLEQSQALTNNSTAVNLEAKTGKLAPYLLEEEYPSTDITRQLWQERVSLSKQPKFNKNKKDLQRIIEQISSIRLDSFDQETEAAIAVDTAAKTEPNDVVNETENTDEQNNGPSDKNGYRLPKGHITEKTLELFKKLAQQPEKLHNPLELAGILFNRNYIEEAAMCYRHALDRINANQTPRPDEKAWVLFQLGNCLHDSEKATAMQMYGQLIEEFPKSTWTEMAKVKSQLIEWYMQDKPHSLIGKQ